MKAQGKANSPPVKVEPDIEYSLANKPRAPELARVHGKETPEEDEDSRVVMVYDADGNATPMSMENFYYDNVQPGESEYDDAASDTDEESQINDTQRSCSTKTSSITVTSERSLEKRLESGPKKMAKEPVQESADRDAAEDDAQEDDQFMRIQAAASTLKAVDKVQKDTTDREKTQKRSRVIGVGSMARAISNVHQTIVDPEKRQPKSPVESAGTHATQHDGSSSSKSIKSTTSGKQRLSAVGRIFSLSKDKKVASGNGQGPQGNSAKHADTSALQAQDRPREAPPVQRNTNTPTKRQTISAVGRILSLSRKNAPSNEKSSTFPATDVNATSSSAFRHRRDGENAENDSEASADGYAQSMPGEWAGGGQKSSPPVSGHSETSARKFTSSSLSSHDEALGNPSNAVSLDRERKDMSTSQSGPGRANLKQAGRSISISKRPPQTQQSTASDDGVSDLNPNGKDIDRKEPAFPPKKPETARVGIKPSGRLLSFSRKPEKTSEAPPERPAQTQAPAESPGSRNNATVKSPRLDGRANRFFFSEILSESIKESALFKSESHIRVPVLVMAEYSGPVSKTKWYIDAFTLPHNAVRRECIDLYDILMSMARCHGVADIRRDDMKEFYSWWIVAYRFFKCYFEMERKVLFPWVDKAGAKDWELQMALNKMRNMKEGLEEQLDGINEIWKGLDVKPPGELYSQVYKGVDAFCPRIMNYFADQELLLPAIVKGVYTIEDRLSMDKDMVESFMEEPLSRKTKEVPHHNLVLLIRWIANPRQLRAWISKNLNSTGRSSYSKWHEFYEEEHVRIVKLLRNRSHLDAHGPSPKPLIER